VIGRKLLSPKFGKHLGIARFAFTEIMSDGVDVALCKDVIVVGGFAPFELTGEVFGVLLELVASKVSTGQLTKA